MTFTYTIAKNSQPGMAESRVNPKGCAQDARNNSQPGMEESRVNPKGCAQDACNNWERRRLAGLHARIAAQQRANGEAWASIATGSGSPNAL